MEPFFKLQRIPTMNPRLFKSSIVMIVLLANTYLATGQCANPLSIHAFTYAGKKYEVIKESKTWEEAAQCALEIGGVLLEINSIDEQQAIFKELLSKANISLRSTIAPDGGHGSYVWIGGNDFSSEGHWIWDRDNDKEGTPFWIGLSDGTPVGGLYNNWGVEPDDFDSQDALAISLNGGHLIGQVSGTTWARPINKLYFVVEYNHG